MMNFSVEKHTLTEMVSLMDDSVGIVHQIPFTPDRVGFSASYEKVTYYHNKTQQALNVVFDFVGGIWHSSRCIFSGLPPNVHYRVHWNVRFV